MHSSMHCSQEVMPDRRASSVAEAHWAVGGPSSAQSLRRVPSRSRRLRRRATKSPICPEVLLPERGRSKVFDGAKADQCGQLTRARKNRQIRPLAAQCFAWSGEDTPQAQGAGGGASRPAPAIRAGRGLGPVRLRMPGRS